MKSAPKTTDLTIEKATALLAEKDSIIDNKSEVIATQQTRIQVLEEYLRLERARHYGRSSEKNILQDELFDEAELMSNDQDGDEENLDTQTETTKKKTGRKGLSKSLPRHQVHLDLTAEEKAGATDTFYTLIKEELDIEPAKARVIEYLQEKAVFVDQGKRSLKSASLPKHPIGKSIASVGLLAFIVVSKYCDGLPLYRLEKILARYGGSVSRTSMANWVIRLAFQLQPLINLMREHQLSHDYLQIDETRMKVLKEPGKSPTSDKWMWVTRGGPPDKPVVLFDYDPSRSGEVAARLIDGFKGYLQSDGYAAYNKSGKRDDIVHLGCWDHARRKFTDAKKGAGGGIKNQKGKVSKYDVALSKINKLYAIEREIKHLHPGLIKEQRQLRSIPLLDELKDWLHKNISKISKDSLTFTAMQYTLNQWPKLINYCEDGRLHISNALAENAIRPFAVGRRGWLFADTPKGAYASSVHYSLVESAKANGLEPYSYLKEILGKLPYAETVEDMEALLPWNVKKL